MAIPKIIHFCWLSGESYPEKIQKCINSWKKYLPDWEIMLWNTKRFDVNSTLWTKQAFETKKYAFVADYVRFYALYNYGGVYLDSDVEVLRSFNDLLEYDCFIGYEYSGMPEAAVVGCIPKMKWTKEALSFYERNSFIKSDGYENRVVAPVVFKCAYESCYNIKLLNTNKIVKHDNNIIFPDEYFSPKNGYSRKIKASKKTYAIHHFSAAWKKQTVKNKANKIFHLCVMRILGKKLFCLIMYKLRSKKQRLAFEQNYSEMK